MIAVLQRLLEVLRRLAHASLVALALSGSAALVIEIASPWPWRDGPITPTQQAELDLAHLATALAEYSARHGRMPSTDDGLAALVHDHLLDSVPQDPWGNPYRYQVGANALQLRSNGAELKLPLCSRFSTNREDSAPLRWSLCSSLLGAEARLGGRGAFVRPSQLRRFDTAHRSQLAPAAWRLANYAVTPS